MTDGELNHILNPHTVDSVSTQNSYPSKELNLISLEKMTYNEQNNVSGDKSSDSSNLSQALTSQESIPSTSICNSNFDIRNNLKGSY
jgi:hypothetical protein